MTVATQRNRVTPFSRWLDGRIGRLDPVGQLTRDALADHCWPRATDTTLEDFRAHLHSHAAAEGVIEALEAAHGEWARQGWHVYGDEVTVGSDEETGAN